MIGRYFLLWLTFFIVVVSGLMTAGVYAWWRGAELQFLAETRAFNVQAEKTFHTQLELQPDVGRWNWDLIHRTWQADFGQSLACFWVQDSLDGEVVFSTTDLPKPATELTPDKWDSNQHFFELPSGEYLWRSAPATTGPPRYQFWVSFGTFPSFSLFVRQRAQALAVLAGLPFVCFLIFYYRFASPERILLHLTDSLNSSVADADNPRIHPPEAFPKEFRRLATAVSRVVETRQDDFHREAELRGQVDQYALLKRQHNQIVETLREQIDWEQSNTDRLKYLLLDVNPDPVIILDRSRRILVMNEAGRRVLGLGGKSNTVFRHPVIDPIIQAGLESRSNKTSEQITLTEPYLNRETDWNVTVNTIGDSGNVTFVILSMRTVSSTATTTRKPSTVTPPASRPAPQAPPRRTEENEPPIPQAESADDALEANSSRHEQLSRAVSQIEGTPRVQLADLPVLLTRSIDWHEPPPLNLELSGTADLWESFLNWFEGLMASKTGHDFGCRARLGLDHRLRLEWFARMPVNVPNWFDGPQGPASRETMEAALEHMQASITWLPHRPTRVTLEVRVPAQQERTAQPDPREGTVEAGLEA